MIILRFGLRLPEPILQPCRGFELSQAISMHAYQLKSIWAFSGDLGTRKSYQKCCPHGSTCRQSFTTMATILAMVHDRQPFLIANKGLFRRHLPILPWGSWAEDVSWNFGIQTCQRSCRYTYTYTFGPPLTNSNENEKPPIPTGDPNYVLVDGCVAVYWGTGQVFILQGCFRALQMVANIRHLTLLIYTNGNGQNYC